LSKVEETESECLQVSMTSASTTGIRTIHNCDGPFRTL